MNFLTMPALHVGNGTHVGGLSVFPIWTDAPTVSGLDTGLTAHVQVDEREGSPVVGELVLKNQGAKPALLVAGELFEGGWQHRALNNDILLVAGQQLVASVSCVEAGRCWASVAYSSASVASLRSWSCSPQRPAFADTCLVCWRPPRSMRRCCRRSRHPVVGLAASSGSSPWHRSVMRWVPTPDPGNAMASRSEYHVIRGLGWEDHLLHATVFNRRHPMMEPA